MTRQGLSKRGFTLFELLFVSVLIAAISTIVLPRVSSSMGLNTKTGVLKVAGFLENGYQKAVLSHQTLRVTIDLEKGEYWADTVNNQDPEIPLIDENTKLDDVLLQFQKKSEEDLSEEDLQALEEKKFSKIEAEGMAPSKLSRGLRFSSVVFPSRNETITTGTASFFISASGLNDQVVIAVSHGEDNTYSIIFPPISGKPKVEKGEVDLANL